MHPHLAHVFIDGAYLRGVGKEMSVEYPDPRFLAVNIVKNQIVQSWAAFSNAAESALFGRATYYDARPLDSEPSDGQLEKYWNAIEELDDVHLAFGGLERIKRGRRVQKGVDVQLGVNLVVGSVDRLFDIAILVAGDADFVPAVEEAKRRGVMVVVVGHESSFSPDLQAASDRAIDLKNAKGTFLRPIVF